MHKLFFKLNFLFVGACIFLVSCKTPPTSIDPPPTVIPPVEYPDWEENFKILFGDWDWSFTQRIGTCGGYMDEEYDPSDYGEFNISFDSIGIVTFYNGERELYSSNINDHNSNNYQGGGISNAFVVGFSVDSSNTMFYNQGFFGTVNKDSLITNIRFPFGDANEDCYSYDNYFLRRQ